MSDEQKTNDVASTEPSTRPKDYVEKHDLPDGLQEDIHALYEAVTDDGSEGGRVENVRLTFRVPPEQRSRRGWTKRSGWLVYACELTHNEFAVPREAAVPVIAMDKPKPSGDGAWLKYKVIHPDLLYDRPRLLDQLVDKIETDLFDLFYDACQEVNLLQALSEMNELPDTDANPYPSRGGERVGYEIVGQFRPVSTD